MTFKQITDSFNRSFHEISGCLYDHQYKYNHLEPDAESCFFEYDSERKKEYAVTICQCYRDLIALSGDIHMFYRFATKESEKEILWRLHINVDDFCDKVLDFVDELRCIYHWDY